MFSCCMRAQEDEVPAQRLKMVVVGDGDCGKTCLLYRFTFDKFFPLYVPTVFEVQTKTVYYKEKEVELVMFDTAGQETYDMLRPLSYKDTDVVVICFSIDSPDSLQNVMDYWLPEIRHFCGLHVPFLLVGNKSDLRDAPTVDVTADTAPLTPDSDTDGVHVDLGERKELPPEPGTQTVLSYQDGLAAATRVKADGYFETSAKLGQGTDAAFETVVRLGLEASRKKSTKLFRHKGK